MSKMRSTCWSLLTVLGALTPGLAQAPANPAQPGHAAATTPVDAALPEQLKELRGLVADSKQAGDGQAIGLIQNLVKDHEQRHPKDRERLAKAFGEVFRTGKLRLAEKDVLYRQAGDALAKLGALGAKELLRALTEPRFDDNRSLQAHLIRALGRTGDTSQVDWLLDTTTRSPRDELRAAAGEALASFTSLPLDGRRRIVKAIVREWGSLHQRATVPDPVPLSTGQPVPISLEPQNARRTLQQVEGPWNTALQQLTGVSMSTFVDWQRWLNKNPNWQPKR